MTSKLPGPLLTLFAARPPLRWLEQTDYAPQDRTTNHYDGVGRWVGALREAAATDDGYVPTESWLDKRDRKRLEKKEAAARYKKEGPASCTIRLLSLSAPGRKHADLKL